MTDNVNHPQHYKSGGIEVIDFIEAYDLGFRLGNSVKYIARAGKKDTAKTLEDLRKAEWYLKREIAALEKAEDYRKTETGAHAFSSEFSSGRVQVGHEEECPLYMGGADPNVTACECFVIRKAKRQADLIGPAHPSFDHK